MKKKSIKKDTVFSNKFSGVKGSKLPPISFNVLTKEEIEVKRNSAYSVISLG